MLVALGTFAKGIMFNDNYDYDRKMYFIVDTKDWVVECVDEKTLKEYIQFLGIKFSNVKLVPAKGHETEEISKGNIDSSTILVFKYVCKLDIPANIARRLNKLSLSVIGNTDGSNKYKFSDLLVKELGLVSPKDNGVCISVGSFAGFVGSDVTPIYTYADGVISFDRYWTTE